MNCLMIRMIGSQEPNLLPSRSQVSSHSLRDGARYIIRDMCDGAEAVGDY